MSVSTATSAVAGAAGAVPAYILILPPGVGLINFPYNPDQLSYTKRAQYHRSTQPTQGTGQAQYGGSHAQSLTVTVILDMFAIPPTPPSAFLPMLEQCLQPNPVNVIAGRPQPPSVTFGWGPNIILPQAVVTALSVTHKRFLLGVPVRTEVQVTLEDLPSILPGQNPTSGALETRRTHMVIEGDTLASIAYREYSDATMWRAIAEANDIDDPMRLQPGTELLVPDRREAENLA